MAQIKTEPVIFSHLAGSRSSPCNRDPIRAYKKSLSGSFWSRFSSRSLAMGKIRSLFRCHRSKRPTGHSHSEAPRSAVPPAADPGDLERVFNKFDANGDGKISSAELAAVLEILSGQPPSEEELGRMMREADIDVRRPQHCSAALEEALGPAFAAFDLDRSGSISADELAHILGGIGEGASLAQCRRMIDGVDRDGDGLVSFEEFKAMMTAGGSSAHAFAATTGGGLLQSNQSRSRCVALSLLFLVPLSLSSLPFSVSVFPSSLYRNGCWDW
ncbi:calcium-binding protein, partial [Musa troglodytarum]